MAGGHIKFGPTYNSTEFVRAALEGSINGFHDIDVTAAEAANGELAGKFAAMTADGLGLAKAKGEGAVGLFRDDLKDMVNASGKGSFYFRGGEYHVAESRLGAAITTFAVGDSITSDANGAIVKAADGDRVLGTVVSVGEFPLGNMYEWAGSAANGGKFLGFVLHM